MQTCDSLLRSYATERGFNFLWETSCDSARRWVADVALGAPHGVRAWWRGEGATEQEALDKASSIAIAYWVKARQSG